MSAHRRTGQELAPGAVTPPRPSVAPPPPPPPSGRSPGTAGMPVVPAGNHRLEATGRVPYPDGSVRVLFRCVVDDCVEGHVETLPGTVADVVLAKLAAEHAATGGAVLDGEIAVIP